MKDTDIILICVVAFSNLFIDHFIVGQVIDSLIKPGKFRLVNSRATDGANGC